MRTRLKPGTIGRARSLRARATDVERKVWYRLRGLKVIGFHFRRQAPFRSYILDFVEHTRGLVIELDGAQHADIRHKLRDEIRDRTLTAEGYKVLRFSNLDVLENIDGTIEYVVSLLNARPPP
jgi:very-short-patch-repair endonuclease